jgi:hypothetical protein
VEINAVLSLKETMQSLTGQPEIVEVLFFASKIAHRLTDIFYVELLIPLSQLHLIHTSLHALSIVLERKSGGDASIISHTFDIDSVERVRPKDDVERFV